MNEMLSQTQSENLFFDPFAENGEETFDPIVSHQKLWERYNNNEVQHDYTADNFVADTEALMMDATFLGRYQQVEMIATQMHILCGEDHNLQQSAQANESFSKILEGLTAHNHPHNHSQDDKADREKLKSEKKKDDKKKRLGWLGWLGSRFSHS